MFKMYMLRDIKVVVRNPSGLYLFRGQNDWAFTAERSQAVVFDYLADKVEAQLALLFRAQGMELEAVPLPPNEVSETCDRCEQLIMPSVAFFDGRQFLCPDCRVIGSFEA